jgi:hypothetical protein
MKNSKDYVWAIFLIFLGTIFLLNTTGILPWNVWFYIFNFWPVFLILAGLRLILGKSLISTIILAIVALIAFLWIGLSAYIESTEINLPFLKNIPTYSTQNIESIDNKFKVEIDGYEDIEILNYKFDLGISEFTITDDSRDFLYIDAKYTNDYGEPKIDERVDNNLLNIIIKENTNYNFSFTNFKTPIYKFTLGSRLPSNINIDNGVGKGTVELDNQKVENLIVDTGTGDIDIVLGLESIPTDKLSLDIGTGNIILNLPENVGYKLNYNVGVGEIKLEDREIGGIGQNGNEILSNNYNTAEKVINITADVGIGNLHIKLNN